MASSAKRKIYQCTRWKNDRNCPRGRDCTFVHAFIEPGKKGICKNHINGRCRYDKANCHFQHLPHTLSFEKYESLSHEAIDWNDLKQKITKGLGFDPYDDKVDNEDLNDNYEAVHFNGQPNAHNPDSKARPTKIKACEHWIKDKTCHFGQDCGFVHAFIETGKKGICQNYLSGHCPRISDRCDFQHLVGGLTVKDYEDLASADDVESWADLKIKLNGYTENNYRSDDDKDSQLSEGDNEPVDENRHKTKIYACKYWSTRGKCDNYEKCGFVHAFIEPGKKGICRNHLEGACYYTESSCYYQHLPKPITIEIYEKISRNATDYEDLMAKVRGFLAPKAYPPGFSPQSKKLDGLNSAKNQEYESKNRESSAVLSQNPALRSTPLSSLTSSELPKPSQESVKNPPSSKFLLSNPLKYEGQDNKSVGRNLFQGGVKLSLWGHEENNSNRGIAALNSRTTVPFQNHKPMNPTPFSSFKATPSRNFPLDSNHSKINELDIPEKYRCPISQDLMEDPVVTEAGSTYDRKSIEDWLKKNDTDPLTRKKVNKKLVPIQQLRTEIREWKSKHQTVSLPPPRTVTNQANTGFGNLYMRSVDFNAMMRDGNPGFSQNRNPNFSQNKISVLENRFPPFNQNKSDRGYEENVVFDQSKQPLREVKSSAGKMRMTDHRDVPFGQAHSRDYSDAAFDQNAKRTAPNSIEILTKYNPDEEESKENKDSELWEVHDTSPSASEDPFTKESFSEDPPIKKSLTDWTVEDVASWVGEIGKGPRWADCAKLCREEGIDGSILEDMTAEELIDVGFGKLHAKKVIKSVKKMTEAVS